MLSLFIKGGPMLWPLLLVSLLTLSTVIERLWFLLQERRLRRPADVEAVLDQIEKGPATPALKSTASSPDFVARALGRALEHPEHSFASAYLQSAARELERFERGLPVLDTVITLAPLLGLLGTVTGLIHSFGILGTDELQAPAALTGGIAEALIATAAGMAIAILALIPFNTLNTSLERARRELEDAGTRAELALAKGRPHDSAA